MGKKVMEKAEERKNMSIWSKGRKELDIHNSLCLHGPVIAVATVFLFCSVFSVSLIIQKVAHPVKGELAALEGVGHKGHPLSNHSPFPDLNQIHVHEIQAVDIRPGSNVGSLHQNVG